jgi:hypothetical protein
MTPQEEEEHKDKEVRANLQRIARQVAIQLPGDWGFVLLAFPFGPGGRMNYVANAGRADIVRAMYEFIEATKAGWGAHVPQDSAAEDRELGRLRQRVAELERTLENKK